MGEKSTDFQETLFCYFNVINKKIIHEHFVLQVF